ncbi:MAG: recombination regulator RecX [Treponema sp.]|jgi:regulatory protein|nr:recombination regulator RecX [Treponema sp.]
MTVVSVKPGTDTEIIRIELSSGPLFSFKTVYVPSLYQNEALYTPGKELSSDEEGILFFAAACYRTERIALRLVARAEQTVVNLTHKLERRGFSPAAVRAVVSRLRELEIVNDKRYAELWIRSRLTRRAESPRALTLSLRHRGIGKEDAQAALKSVLTFENEWALLQRYLMKKRRIIEGGDLSLKYCLKSEGFSGPVLDRYWEEEEF